MKKSVLVLCSAMLPVVLLAGCENMSANDKRIGAAALGGAVGGGVGNHVGGGVGGALGAGGGAAGA